MHRKSHSKAESVSDDTAVPYHNTGAESELIAIGRVNRAQGLRGELRVIKLSNVADRFSSLNTVILELKNGTRINYTIEYVTESDNHVLIKLYGVHDRNDAEALKGAYIMVKTNDIPPLDNDYYYSFDLVGMDVYDTGDEKIGTIKKIEHYPAQDVLVIELKGKTVMLPAVKEYILEIDVKTKTMRVDIPEGLPVYPDRVRM